MKKAIILLLLTVFIITTTSGCKKNITQKYTEEAGLSFYNEQKACSVCGESLEPGTFGKEGCYREVTGEYLTMEEYVKYHFSSPVDPHIPLPPKHESCPTCGAVLEPKTFGKEGCYRTESGYYITKDQYRRLSLSCDIDVTDSEGKIGYALILYDNPDSCGEDYIIPTYLHKDDYIHTQPLSEKMTKEKVAEFAEDELKNSAFASYLDEAPIIKLAPTNEEGKTFRVSFYWTNKPFQIVHVYINKNGETTDMYVHER